MMWIRDFFLKSLERIGFNMSLDMEFYLKLFGAFVVSGLVVYNMELLQRRKEEAAERQFQETLKMIELRNKIYKPKE